MIRLRDNIPWIEPKTTQGFIQSLSGVFRLTPKEIKVFAILLYLVKQKDDPSITTDMKEEIATITGHSIQVITNYITKFKKKKVIVDNRPHFIFLNSKIIINYEE